MVAIELGSDQDTVRYMDVESHLLSALISVQHSLPALEEVVTVRDISVLLQVDARGRDIRARPSEKNGIQGVNLTIVNIVYIVYLK